MNYSINIDQLVLSKWRGRIDGDDAIILAHIRGLLEADNDEVAKWRIAGGYVWIDYNYILRENPLLNMGYTALRNRLRKMQELGILEKQTTDFGNGKLRSFFRFGNAFKAQKRFWKKKLSEEADAAHGAPQSPTGKPHRVRKVTRQKSDTGPCQKTDTDPNTQDPQAPAQAGAPMEAPAQPGQEETLDFGTEGALWEEVLRKAQRSGP